MHAITATAEAARWEVIWVSAKGKVKRTPYDDNFPAALKGLQEAIAEGKRFATLRCCNVGFAPPPELRPQRREFRPPRMLNGELVSSVLVRPLGKLNREGVWWCPYCIKLRKFTKKRRFELDGIEVKDDSLACPICGISHKDGHVRRWNPMAVELYEGGRRVTEPDARRRRRARRRASEEEE